MGNLGGGVMQTWELEPGELPVIASTFDLHCRMTPRQVSFQMPCWVLNCGLIPCEVHSKVGLQSRPWRPRRVEDLHLYRPGVRVWEDFRGKPFTECHGLALLFKMRASQAFRRQFPPEREFYEFLDPEGKGRAWLQEACAAVAQEGERALLCVQAALLSVMDLLLRSQLLEGNVYSLAPTVTPAAQEDEFSGQIHSYMRSHLAKRLTVTQLARHMRVSEIQLFKRYKRESGVSPMRRFAAMRIEQAKALVMHGLPLDYVAEQTGFCDAFHLSKTFKRIVGLSPKAYQRQRAAPSRPENCGK